MSLRIHFTAEDLGRTRLASGPRPLLELNIGIRQLQEKTHPLYFDAWRHRTSRHLHLRFRPLFELIPSTGAAVGFLGSLTDDGHPADLVERLRSTPAKRAHRDLEEWAGQQAARLSPETRRASESAVFVKQLAKLVEEAHEGFIAPYWPQIDRLAAADRILRLKHLSEHGVERLLHELNPRRIIWKPPVLHVTMAPGLSDDVHLGGRGLLLVPTLFGSHCPVLGFSVEQPYITFPIRSDQPLSAAPAAVTATALAEPPQSLTALLGRTRALVLRVMADHPGSTTTQLAEHARVSLASASEHATVLRNAGLATHLRDGKHALHTLTPAGHSLLAASSGP